MGPVTHLTSVPLSFPTSLPSHTPLANWGTTLEFKDVHRNTTWQADGFTDVHTNSNLFWH